MRAELAPFGVDALLLIAGLGTLLALGLTQPRIPSLLGALGLAYITGSAIVSTILIALLVLGVPFTLITFLIVASICALAGVLRIGRAGGRRPSGTAWRLGPLRSWTADNWALVSFTVLFGALAIVGMLGAVETPLSGWDAWSIWTRKAQMLAVDDHLSTSFFANSSYAFAHLDYPLQYPIWEALHFRAGANFDTQILARHLWLLFVSFVWGVAYLLRRQVPPLVWAPILLLVAVAPGVWQQILSLYADVPMAMYVCLGAICLAIWLAKNEVAVLALAVIMLGAAANTKNEGLVAALAILLVAGLITAVQKLDVRAFLIGAAAVIVAVLPWRVWTSAHGIEGDMPISKGLDPGYLLDRADRVWPAIEAIATQMANQGKWMFLLPLAALVVVASLASGAGRRPAVFYLGSFVLTSAALVWSYWISPHDLSWHLSTSVDRVVAIPMFICVAAVLHLSGALVHALKRWRTF